MSRSKLFKRILSAAFGVCLGLGIIPCSIVCNRADAATTTTLDQYEDTLSSYSVEGNVEGYDAYLQEHESASRPSSTIEIDAANYIRTEGMDVETMDNYEGMEGTSVKTDESGLIEYEVNITEAGLYDLSLLYYPIKGKNAAIQRGVFIDGKLPYSELALLEFQRVWVNGTEEWEKDNQGNDLKPTQVEAPQWMTSNLYDSEGYVTDNLSVYLDAGVHTITMISIREPMVLRKIILGNSEKIAEYKTVLSTYNASEYSGETIEIQAEYANRKSSQMLYPQQDSNSPEVSPYSAKCLLNNIVGGGSWSMPGQWLEWDFEAPEDGLYEITLHAKQSYVKGIYVSRKIYIDGAVPFEEMNDYGFRYNQSWQMNTLANEDGETYKFHLTAGRHTLRMEVVLGDFSKITSAVQDVVSDLNAVYRKVIRITGVAPDTYRDYQIEKTLPELENELIVVRDELDQVLTRLEEVAGKGSDKETVLVTMRDQLNDLIADQEYFSKILGSFKTNVRACGNWISSAIAQPLGLDAIYIHAPGEKMKSSGGSSIDKVVHEAKKLYYSFVIDYNQIGNVADEDTMSSDNTITVWVGTGRDQANVIKSLIDSSFTGDTGINVNVMLVNMQTLLQATLAGQGPDVAVQVSNAVAAGMPVTQASNDIPMNYGIRNAVADLAQFDDLPEIEKRFYDSAMTPFKFDGKVFALPETQSFLMMFYRKDILKELDMELPKTWDEMKVALSVLSKNQMDLGMLPNELAYAMFLYQNDGDYYNEDGSRCILDDDAAINAFKEYCEYYTDYKLDQETSVEERFRTGESPLIIADYTVYNNLAVSAPDIQGLWGFAPVPGTVKANGTVDNTTASTGTAAILMNDCKNKEAGWEFLKWWTSAETMSGFNNEMESLMGSAARVAVANKEAFATLPWSSDDYEALAAQFENVRGIPQVPGGYYTWRNVNNAFYKVVTETDTTTPRESLMDKVILINDEIDYKRQEFGYPVAQD